VADNPEILVLTTGGTIDKVYFDAKSEYEVGQSIIGTLLEQAHVGHPYRVREVLKKDSLDMTEEDRQLIRNVIETHADNKIVITHGTDTMTDTAAAINGIENRTIVLTGSLAPARFAMSDAMFNIGMAFGVVQSKPPGVYIVMNGTVFDADKVKKDREANQFVTL
jgi:L-asparaginase